MEQDLKSRLRQLRMENLKTQDDLAKLLNIGRSTYAEYERGKFNPSTESLKKIAEYYQVSVDYLVGNTEGRNLFEHEVATYDASDIGRHLSIITEALKDKTKDFKIYGKSIDDKSRAFLLSTIENALMMIDHVNEKG